MNAILATGAVAEPAVEEGRQVQHLRHAHAELARHREKRLPEGVGARAVVGRVRIIPERRDGGLVVAAQRNEKLRAAQRKQLLEERRAAEHESGPRREAQDELYLRAAGTAE